MIGSVVRPQFGPRADPRRNDDLEGVDYDKWLRPPPPRDWVVDGCFLRNNVGLVSGIGGVGKSLLMQQLATCATMGRPWLGISLKAGRALLLACEDDDDELHRRQEAINRSMGIEMADVLDAGLDCLPRHDRDNTLMEIDRPNWRMRPTPLMDKLFIRCRRLGIQYVILDTVTAVYGGRDIDARLVAAFIMEMQRLAIMLQGIVILVQHPSRSGARDGTGENGSVQWNNKVRSRLYFHEDKDHNLTLDGVKANYGPKPKPIPLIWRRGVFERVEPPPARDYSEPGGY
jgi:RecA-family ATPase